MKHRGILLCPCWDGGAVCGSRAQPVWDRDALVCSRGHVVSGLDLHRSGLAAPLPSRRLP